MDECECTRSVEMAVKKRKLGFEDSEQCSSNYDTEEVVVESYSSEKFGFLENLEETDGDLTSSDRISASVSSSNDDDDDDDDDSGAGLNCVRSVHLEAKRFETEISTTSDININKISSEKTQQSEISSTSPSPMEKQPAKTQPRRNKPPKTAKMPSAAELESFFSAAEKYEQKRFAEKYNYDVVNDVPMDGRYEWIQLKP